MWSPPYAANSVPLGKVVIVIHFLVRASRLAVAFPAEDLAEHLAEYPAEHLVAAFRGAAHPGVAFPAAAHRGAAFPVAAHLEGAFPAAAHRVGIFRVAALPVAAQRRVAAFQEAARYQRTQTECGS